MAKPPDDDSLARYVRRRDGRRERRPKPSRVRAPYVRTMTDCTYCGCAVEAHDPVFVYEERDGEREPAGRFCNYGCLSAHVEEAGLADGARCRLDA